MYDFHIHSIFSDDCSTPLDSIPLKAWEKGLKGICITDHKDIDYPNPEVVFDYDYHGFSEAVKEEKLKFQGKLEIYKGIELGLQPCVREKNAQFLQGKEYDFIIGSIHAVKSKGLWKSNFLDDCTDHQGILNYFGDMLACIADTELYDVLGHLDGIKRYLIQGEKSFLFSSYIDFIEAVLKRLIDSGKGIELNTSGVRYGLIHHHPSPEILTLYKKLGGDIITLGSDAHRPEDVGYEIRAAQCLLRQLNFKYYTIFKQRKPVFIKL